MLRLRPLLAAFLLTLTSCSLQSPAAAGEPDVRAAIAEKIEALRKGEGAEVVGVSLSSVTILPLLYERRDWAPAWSDDQAASLLAVIRRAPEFGLRSEDYHLRKLEELRASHSHDPGDPELRARYDLLLTDAVIRAAYHESFGKVDPKTLDPHWNLERRFEPAVNDPAREIQGIIDAPDLSRAFDSRLPNRELYHNNRRGLSRYREIATRGGWEGVAAGPVLKPGAEGARVVALRRRLAATGDLDPDAPSSPSFDDTLEEAVRRFQRRHYLDADGIVGPGTLEAMNVPVEERIDQIRVNLERLRWVLHGLTDEFVLVDIAGFDAFYYRDDEQIWRSRVQVGRPFRSTPVFRDEIEYIEINPTWTVPPGILKKDVLPKIRADVGYLERKEMEVVDHRNGRRVDPASIDWANTTAGSFPYRIVQRPGPRNALGRIKFMFPNPHLVFLHDTPSRALFERRDRAFSSGCIRVERPFELAALLLDDPQDWSREQVLAAVDSKETRRLNLRQTVPVILLYWTVESRADGSVYFKKDLYDRDARILRALNEDFRFHPHHVEQGGPL